MPTFIRRSEMPGPAEALFAWHARPGAFERLSPPWQPVRVLSRTGGIAPGDTVRLALGPGPLALPWLARHGQMEPGRSFSDEQVSGPFASWTHVHRCLPLDGDRSTLEDEVRYTLPLGPLGALAGGGFVASELTRMFRFRHTQTRRDLERHRAVADRGSLRVAISGASGLIGAALAAFLSTGGHEVLRLVRHPAREPGEIQWDPARGTIDAARLEGLDAVVHLAGENIGGGRWSEARKASILNSRVQGTRTLANAIAGLAAPPRVFLSASAIGAYGDRGDAPISEADAPGTGYLADVCAAWEAAADPARDAGVRVVHPRFGVVLSPRGGALEKLLLPFRLGAGGVVGSGRQVMSWVALDDVVGALHFLLFADGLSGPVNVTAPGPVTNAEFTRTLGRVLHRPTIAPLPALAVKGIFGEMGDALLLEGARVLPAKLTAAGFAFVAPDLEGAFREMLGAWDD